MTHKKNRVCLALCDREYWTQAWTLSAVEGGRDEVARRWGAHLLQKCHPFDALAHARTHAERQCLMRCILQDENVLPPSGARMMPNIGDMSDFVTIFREKMATTLKAMGERTPYTYQLVQRLKATSTTIEGKRVVDGEMLRRVFICFANAGLALNFVELWRHAQQLVIGRQQLEKATCLLECGTYDQTLRKWVLDVDASILELKKDATLWPLEVDEALIKQNLHDESMQMAQNVATVLWKMGYLYRPCHYAVTTRHSPKKMSWHITLCALASHETWRKALLEVEEKYDVAATLGKMYAYVDKGTKNNSKSQYMQARGSTKVAAGVKADGNFFKDVGLFDGPTPVPIPASRHSILFYAATSVVVHDPWSLPFRHLVQSPSITTTTISKKRKPSVSVQGGQRSGKKAPSQATPIDMAIEQGMEIVPITNWDLIPHAESAWMRLLIERSDGSTRLTSIPSMSNPQHWCWDVVTILNAGRGQVKLYAKVEFPALCPKYLKAKKQVYQHGSTNGMTLMVVEERIAECKLSSFRMFARCFSEKCRHMPSPYCSGGWIELNRADYLLVRVKKVAPVASPEHR
jgi:hypothetical protein